MFIEFKNVLRKIAAEIPQMPTGSAAGSIPAFIQKHRGSLLRGFAGGALLGRAIPPGYGVQQMTNKNRGGSAKNTPVIPQRPSIPAPADDPAPSNQRPAGYGTTPKPVSPTWLQKIKDDQNGLSDPVTTPDDELRRYLNQRGQRLENSPARWK